MPLRLLLFAGPNGSGKSTLTTPVTLRRFGIPAQRYINADDIARTLRNELPDTGQEERERLAFRRARELRQVLREQGESFAFETVFSHPSTLLDMLRCRAAGYEIVVVFVSTRNPQINVARVARRHQAGGHDVPVDRILSRYARGMRLLPRIIEEADIAFVHDNSEESVQVFPFHAGQPVDQSGTFPEFWQRVLIEPLKRRHQEREQLNGLFLPDEASGEYRGRMVTILTQYVVQEIADGTLVRHDRLLLPESTGNDDYAASVRVRYVDAEGTLSPSPEESS